MTDKPDSNREGTDEALMVRYQRGDRNALLVIVRRYARLVYATAFGISDNAQIAAELTESSFLSLVGHAGNFHIEMHFRSWLFGFLHQHIVEKCSKPAAESPANELAAIAIGAAVAELETEPPILANRVARSQLLSRRISECTQGMALPEREAIVLKLTAQLTLAELATSTTSDGDTVRARLRLALERLRESVSDTEDFARALR